MSADLIALDTNILFYATDSAAGGKHATAESVLEQLPMPRTIIPLQVLGELVHSVTRKRPAELTTAERLSEHFIRSGRVFPAIEHDFSHALALVRQHNLQFWDALIVATSLRAGCRFLLSEDLQDGRHFSSLQIRNPFAMNAAELQTILA